MGNNHEYEIIFTCLNITCNACSISYFRVKYICLLYKIYILLEKMSNRFHVKLYVVKEETQKTPNYVINFAKCIHVF